MLLQFSLSKEISELFRFIFLAISFIALIVLSYKMYKNKERYERGVFALIYFGILFAFYLARLVGYPDDVYLANIISNVIHLLASIFIFSIAFMLIGEKK